MQTIKMKYLGDEPTKVRTVPNGEKVEVKKGGVVEIHEGLAKSLATSYKRVWVRVDEAPKKEAPKKEEPKVEGGLDESKVEKAVPKKKK